MTNILKGYNNMNEWRNEYMQNSSCLAGVMSFKDACTLRVVFEGGKVWDYKMTDAEEVDEYIGYFKRENLYGSVGAYYHRDIKGQFESNEVTEAFAPASWVNEEDAFFDELESADKTSNDVNVKRDGTRTIQQLDTLGKFHADKVIRGLKDVILDSISVDHELSCNEVKYLDMIITDYIKGLEE